MNADQLRRAATLLREAAGKATEGPWVTHRAPRSLRILNPARSYHVAITGGPEDWQAEMDAAWITLANPEIGGLLADVLDLAAQQAERGPCDAQPHACNHCADPDWGTVGLLAIAQTILGETS